MSERTETPDRADRAADRKERQRSRRDSATRLDQPRELHKRLLPRPGVDAERFGVLSEQFARFMGTPAFLIYMTVFVVVWLGWNTFLPPSLQFDPKSLNYTLLTLILSLQASYAAPLILLAQNRQDDRDRVALEQDRGRDDRNLADTEFLTREVASLRLALRDTATRDFVRSELRNLLDELEERGMLAPPASDEPKPRKKKDKQPKSDAAKSDAAKTETPEPDTTDAPRSDAAEPNPEPKPQLDSEAGSEAGSEVGSE